MLKLINVNVSFGETKVLEDFSAEFFENKINCIIGPSGCGKSTILNLISGTLKSFSGNVEIPEKVSFVFQEELLIPQKTARQNLEIVLKSVYSDKQQLKNKIDSFLAEAGLLDSADLYPHEMSGGMRQRLSLVRAFLYPSEVLLLDEPFKALDMSLKNNLIDWFKDLYKQNPRTAIFVTHDIDEAVLLSDYIFVYSDKPMKLNKMFELNFEQRRLSDERLGKIESEIYKEIEKWRH